MTHVSTLAMGAFRCNSHVTNVTLKTIEIGVNTKVALFLRTSMLFATNACGFIQTGIFRVSYRLVIQLIPSLLLVIKLMYKFPDTMFWLAMTSR